MSTAPDTRTVAQLRADLATANRRGDAPGASAAEYQLRVRAAAAPPRPVALPANATPAELVARRDAMRAERDAIGNPVLKAAWLGRCGDAIEQLEKATAIAPAPATRSPARVTYEALQRQNPMAAAAFAASHSSELNDDDAA